MSVVCIYLSRCNGSVRLSAPLWRLNPIGRQQILRTSVRLLQARPKPKKTKSTTRQSVELYQVVRLLLPIGCGAQYAVNIFSMIMIAKTGRKVKLPKNRHLCILHFPFCSCNATFDPSKIWLIKLKGQNTPKKVCEM